jgi:hypothetical protein
MSRRALCAALALAVMLCASPGASAQTVEVAAYGGLAFGGELIATPGYESVPLQAGLLYGGAFNVEFRPRWRLEALVMRQETNVPGPAYGTYIDVNVDRYMGAILSHEPLSPRWDVFGEFMLGATRYAPRGFASELWFTLGAAAGVKTYVTRNIGFRFEARGYYTPVVISGATVCGGYGCVIGYTGTGTFQGDISAGVIIGF